MEIFLSTLLSGAAILATVKIMSDATERQLNQERAQKEKLLEKFMARNYVEYKQQQNDGSNEVVPPPSDFDEWKQKLQRMGADFDELSRIKETSPTDVYE